MSMDLVTLLETFPPLLHACVDAKLHASYEPTSGFRKSQPNNLPAMRLVCKEFSRVAMLGQKSYTLQLADWRYDTSVRGAMLLHGAELEQLTVRVRASAPEKDVFKLASIIETFVLGASASLGSVNCLQLKLDKKFEDVVASAALRKSLALLVAACPAVKTLHALGYFSPAFWHSVSETWTQLCDLTLSYDAVHEEHLQTVVNLLPSLFPRVNSLALVPTVCNARLFKMPDLSNNGGIVSLSLHLEDSQSDCEFFWQMLPPTLRHLKCSDVWHGPSNSDRAHLASLLTLEVHSNSVDLNVLSKILAAAPAVQISGRPASNPSASPTAFLVVIGSYDYYGTDHPTVEEFAVLNSPEQLSRIRDFTLGLRLGITKPEDGVCHQVASFPLMAHISRCDFWDINLADLLHMFNVFPNLRELDLSSQNIDDLGLHDMATHASNLKTLHLNQCSNITSAGILALSLALPDLYHVMCKDCRRLEPRVVQNCAQLLRRLGSAVEISNLDYDYASHQEDWDE